MEQPSSRLEYLFGRYAAGICTDQERDEYLELVKMETHARALQELIRQAVEEAENGKVEADNGKSLSPDERARILEAIVRGTESPVISMEPRRSKRFAWWAAAAVLVLLGSGAWLWLSRRDSENPAAKTIVVRGFKNDISPGGNKAVLILANGATITLDSAANGMLAQQGNATVLKTNNGRLAYHTTSEKPTGVLYNTLATPRGGQYQLVLPDGSKVWLNAASSIRYPTAFSGSARQVDITGEAYFEIAKDARMPFAVRMGSPAGAKGEIKVLGTSFNVNAYDEEPEIRTTLVEGAVKVVEGAAAAVLKPGQQSQLTASGKIKVVNDADVEEALAWKNGRLLFKHADMESIMRQAARWYDVGVVFKDKIEDTYTLSVSRNVPISKLIAVLELNSGVHFTIEGKKITVTK